MRELGPVRWAIKAPRGTPLRSTLPARNNREGLGHPGVEDLENPQIREGSLRDGRVWGTPTPRPRRGARYAIRRDPKLGEKMRCSAKLCDIMSAFDSMIVNRIICPPPSPFLQCLPASLFTALLVGVVGMEGGFGRVSTPRRRRGGRCTSASRRPASPAWRIRGRGGGFR